MPPPLSNAEKCIRYREHLKRMKLRVAQSIMAIVATQKAQALPPPKGIFISPSGFPYYLDRKGISLRWIKGYHDA